MKNILCKVIVPLAHDWFFKLVCPGNAMSVSFDRLLLLKNATVNGNLGFDDVCVEKHVYVAYRNAPMSFEVSDTGEMVKFPTVPKKKYWSVCYYWEIQEAFAQYNNIKHHWVNGFASGTLNYTTGQWSGAAGLVQRDEADYAINDFLGSYERSKVAAFTATSIYLPLHWITRYPQELSPTWNLLGLFTKGYNHTYIHNI